MESYSVQAVLSARDEMSRVLENAGNKTQTFGQKLKSAIGLGGAMQIGMKAVSGAMNLVSSSVGSAVSRFDQLNNFPKVMANMKIPAEDAEKALNRASEAMAKLPTSLDTASSGIQRFTSANGDIEKSTDYFLALNDAVIAGGQPMQTQQSAIEQLSQAYSKGKMDMMEWRSLQQAMPAQLNQVAEAMGMTTDALGEGLRSGSISMDEFMGKVVELDQNGTNGFKSFKEQAEASCDGIQTAISNVKTAITRGLANAFSSVDEALKNGGLPTIGQSINNLIPIIDNVSSKVGVAIENIIGLLSGKVKGSDFGEAFANAFNSVLDKVGGIVKNLASKFVDALPSIAEAIGSALPSIVTGIFKLALNLIANAIPLIVKAGASIITGLIKGISSKLGSLTSKVSDFAKKIPKTIADKVKDVGNIGKNIIKGLWNGASSMVSWVVGKFKSLGKSILSGIKGALGIHSPSRVFRDEVGKNIMLGIVEGIKNTSPVVHTAIDTVTPSSNTPVSSGSSYSFGNITLSVDNLKDVATIEEIANVFMRAKAFV